ncbi:MAG TPA: hypothetical protein PKI61_00610 [bacterium]|nr:hypothetical protein [bacterium]HPT29389.1 hypothetical protein [bacterium]
MINATFIKSLKAAYREANGERRQIGSLANIVLHDSKRVIFALHRGELKDAKAQLEGIEKILKELSQKFGVGRLNEEGSYHAAIEEYVEAKLLYNVLTAKKIDTIKGLKLPPVAYLGGICDLLGEMVRLATNEGAKGNWHRVSEIKKEMNEIMATLIEFDFTGYLRTKYDQARNHLRKVEQMEYEVKLRQK